MMRNLIYLTFVLLLCQGALGQTIYRISLNLSYQQVELVRAKGGSYSGKVVCASSPLNSGMTMEIKSYPIPGPTVKKLMKRLKEENIETLPDCRNIEGYAIGEEGPSVKFEISIGKKSWGFSYFAPEGSLLDAQIMEIQNVRFILNALRSELNLGKVFADFRRSLLPGTSITDGYFYYFSPLTQDKSSTADPDAPRGLDVWDERPQFPGGDTALITFLSKNIDITPEIVSAQDPQKRIGIPVGQRQPFIPPIQFGVNFLVGKDGTLSDIQISNNAVAETLKNQHGTDVKKAIERMPQWIPGKSEGESAKVRVYIPIKFKSDTNMEYKQRQ